MNGRIAWFPPAANGLLLAALLFGAPSSAAQEGPATPEAAARILAGAWGRADLGAIEGLLATEGLTLRLEGDRRVGVAPRQARASLAEFLGRHEPEEVRLRRTEALGGDPPRAFAEFEWTARPRSTQDSTTVIIFVGLERDGDRWIVSEIRVLS